MTRSKPLAWRSGVLFTALAALVLIGVSAWSAAARTASSADGRVIVLGFDGADARTAGELMEAGQLPNLKKLADSGTFGSLLPSNPAESPVSWAALNTGQNPAKTGVPGFVRRDWFSTGTPKPVPGHLVGPKQVPIEEFSNTPIPTWEPPMVGAAAGAIVLVAFLVVFALLLRLRLWVSLLLSLVLAGVGFWGGMASRAYLPSELPKFENPLQSTPFWETAAEAGVKSVVLDAAQCFDREPVDGARVLAGLGVPDARGGINSFFVYTTDELVFDRPPKGKETSSGGFVFRVEERDGKIESALYGPSNHWEVDRLSAQVAALKEKRDGPNVGFKESVALDKELKALEKKLKEFKEGRLEAPLVVERGPDSAKVTIDGHTQTLKEGEWSDWYHVTFNMNWLLKAKAVTRVKLVHLNDPHFELYVDALGIDPASPPFWQPISQPHGFSSELAKSGPFETVGWACMNLPFKDEVVDPVSFMQDIEFTMKWRERLTYDALEKGDWRLFFSCFSTTDRVQHMMYQYYDPQHPMHDAEKAAQEFEFFGRTITLAEAIPAIYREMDRVVGHVIDNYVGEGDTLILCADHGFQTFRRQVHLNNWLIEKGYMKLKEGVSRRQSSLLTQYVDWSQTQAYSLGLGMVYLNMKDREADGIVEPSEARALMEKIRADFVASTDGEGGPTFGKEAYIVSDIHNGKFLDREADMLLCFDAGYRISWGSTGGGFNAVTDDNGVVVAGPTVVDSDKNWCGDHVSVDPSLVQGIFFSNRKVVAPADGFDLLHVAPTVLAVLGVDVPQAYDMPPLELQ